MSKFVNIGQQVYVRADEIVAIHDEVRTDFHDFTIPPWGGGADSVVILRSGQILPGYLSAWTIRKRVEEALAKAEGRAEA